MLLDSGYVKYPNFDVAKTYQFSHRDKNDNRPTRTQGDINWLNIKPNDVPVCTAKKVKVMYSCYIEQTKENYYVHTFYQSHIDGRQYIPSINGHYKFNTIEEMFEFLKKKNVIDL